MAPSQILTKDFIKVHVKGFDKTDKWFTDCHLALESCF